MCWQATVVGSAESPVVAAVSTHTARWLVLLAGVGGWWCFDLAPARQAREA